MDDLRGLSRQRGYIGPKQNRFKPNQFDYFIDAVTGQATFTETVKYALVLTVMWYYLSTYITLEALKSLRIESLFMFVPAVGKLGTIVVARYRRKFEERIAVQKELEDVVKRRTKKHSQREDESRKYRVQIAQSAFALKTRIEEILNGYLLKHRVVQDEVEGASWTTSQHRRTVRERTYRILDSDYAKFSTMYTFSQLFCWLEVLRSEVHVTESDFALGAMNEIMFAFGAEGIELGYYKKDEPKNPHIAKHSNHRRWKMEKAGDWILKISRSQMQAMGDLMREMDGITHKYEPMGYTDYMKHLHGDDPTHREEVREERNSPSSGRKRRGSHTPLRRKDSDITLDNAGILTDNYFCELFTKLELSIVELSSPRYYYSCIEKDPVLTRKIEKRREWLLKKDKIEKDNDKRKQQRLRPKNYQAFEEEPAISATQKANRERLRKKLEKPRVVMKDCAARRRLIWIHNQLCRLIVQMDYNCLKLPKNIEQRFDQSTQFVLLQLCRDIIPKFGNWRTMEIIATVVSSLEESGASDFDICSMLLEDYNSRENTIQPMGPLIFELVAFNQLEYLKRLNPGVPHIERILARAIKLDMGIAFKAHGNQMALKLKWKPEGIKKLIKIVKWWKKRKEDEKKACKLKAVTKKLKKEVRPVSNVRSFVYTTRMKLGLHKLRQSLQRKNRFYRALKTGKKILSRYANLNWMMIGVPTFILENIAYSCFGCIACAVFIAGLDGTFLHAHTIYALLTAACMYRTAMLCICFLWVSSVYQSLMNRTARVAKNYHKHAHVQQKGKAIIEDWVHALGEIFIWNREKQLDKANPHIVSNIAEKSASPTGLVIDMENLPAILADHNLHVHEKENEIFLEEIMNVLKTHKTLLQQGTPRMDKVSLNLLEFSVFVESIESATLDKEIMELLWEPRILQKVLNRYNESSNYPKIVPLPTLEEELSLYCTPKDSVSWISERNAGIDVDAIEKGLSQVKQTCKSFRDVITVKEHDGKDIYLRVQGLEKVAIKKNRLLDRVSNSEIAAEIEKIDYGGTYEITGIENVDQQSLAALQSFCHAGRVYARNIR